MPDEPVHHDEQGHRFVLKFDQGEAVLRYHARGPVLDLYHVYVPPEGRGKGLAQKVTRAALDHARAHGLKIIPTCPFVRQYVERSKADHDLIQPA